MKNIKNEKVGLFNIADMRETEPSNLLADRFLVPPFSVFDTKQGYWMNRKRDWVAIGIQSELGRGDNLTYNLGSFDYEEEKKYQADKKKSKFGKSLPEGFDEEKYGIKQRQATSIFDPVLCEIAYRWFALPNAKVLDPFAGGSVRGIVAGVLGLDYTGIDLSGAQVEANKAQWQELNTKFTALRGKADWVVGNSENSKELAKGKYDMIFSCPPYYDLEVYSDNPEDLSAMGTYKDFLKSYRLVIANAVSMLKEDSFAVFVVGDVRDKKTGEYYNFVGDTVEAFKDAGTMYYNEGILLNSIGTLPLRVPKQFNAGRKLGKQHQNVLVFYKGDPKRIKDKFGTAEIEQ